MSLKTQLRISIVTLVTSLVMMVCVATLRLGAQTNFDSAILRALEIAEQVKQIVITRVNEQVRTQPVANPAGDVKALYERIVLNDSELPSSLERSMAASNSNAVVEILVCNQAGLVLASSLPGRSQAMYQKHPDFNQWKERPLWDRLVEVLMSDGHDYEIVTDLTNGSEPVLNIRVLISSDLIGQSIMPQVKSLAGVSALSLLASVVLAFLFSNVVFRSLDRLSRRIETIAAGSLPPEVPPAREAKEFADMQSKLDALGQQFRGAKEDVQKLRTNVERMLERLEEAVLLFDPEMRLLRASRPAERLLAAKREQLAGKTLEELFPGAVATLVREAMQRRIPIRDAVVSLERPESSSARVLVNMEVLEGFPTPGRSSMVLTLRDAETRRQIRSQLDISTRLAAISRLTGGVAHEIKNPLNAMALHLEILKSKLNKDDEVSNEMSVIGGEIARLDRVVKTFLDFTRPVEVRLTEMNLVELARQVAALVWPQAERSRVSIELEAPEPMALIRGDDDLLKQAVLNVVNNGIEAMKNGGRLQISVAREGDEVVASISDEGGGIPEELREKIFNLYFSTKQKGSGIGLAMTFRIVQLHNATIDFTTEPGRGTTFHLRFPAVEEGVPAQILEEASAQRLAQ